MSSCISGGAFFSSSKSSQCDSTLSASGALRSASSPTAPCRSTMAPLSATSVSILTASSAGCFCSSSRRAWWRRRGSSSLMASSARSKRPPSLSFSRASSVSTRMAAGWSRVGHQGPQHRADLLDAVLGRQLDAFGADRVGSGHDRGQRGTQRLGDVVGVAVVGAGIGPPPGRRCDRAPAAWPSRPGTSERFDPHLVADVGAGRRNGPGPGRWTFCRGEKPLPAAR